MKQIFIDRIQESIALREALLKDPDLMQTLEEISNALIACYRSDGRVWWCGNGGSAADAQHLAAELSGRFYFDRPPLASEALHVNTSYITAVANDYSYDEIYARLIRGAGRQGDVLIGLSTSGNSPNVIRALQEARSRQMTAVGFTGADGGRMREFCHYWVGIPSTDTPRIQECHMLLGHTLCELVETTLFGNDQ